MVQVLFLQLHQLCMVAEVMEDMAVAAAVEQVAVLLPKSILLMLSLSLGGFLQAYRQLFGQIAAVLEVQVQQVQQVPKVV